MPTSDRRHSPRVHLDQLAYLNIEPENGGIVLNVSEGGLCFRSMGPIPSDRPLRLSLQELNRKIEIHGELVWTDDLNKSGGLRFNTLSKEARARISDWTLQTGPSRGASSTLGAALLKALPLPETRRMARSFRPAMAWWKSGRRVKISGFTRGLAVGFLLSLSAFSILFFSYQHRAYFGESLIRIGNRLEGTPVPDRVPRSAPQPIAVVTPPASPPAPIPFETKPALKAPSRDVPPHAHSEADDVTIRWLSPPRQQIASGPTVHAQSPTEEGKVPAAKNPAASASSLLGVTEPASVVPVAALERPDSMSKPGPFNAGLHSEVAPSPSHPGSRVQMFFDLGRFKKEPMAQDLRQKILTFGIESTVVSKRHLWGNSYQVLAGPFDDDDAEKQISTALFSHGYKPRPFERGTRDFSFHSRLTVDGAPLPTGNFTVAWESYIAEAKVQFSQGSGLLAAVDGKWVKHDAKFAQNEYVYRVQPDGSRPLLEIHFGGMDRALVFQAAE